MLPLLRLIWPRLVQPPAKKSWDHVGIDLWEWADEGPFPVIVQCKGFEVRDLGDVQVRQAVKSIRAFRDSEYECATYVLVHNRGGKDREFADAVSSEVATLVAQGKAVTAELWDLGMVIKKVFERTEQLVAVALQDQATVMRNRFALAFRFGQAHLRLVPASIDHLRFRRDQPCLVDVGQPAGKRDVSAMLIEPNAFRWTMLTGLFGVGKTSSVLHAATSPDVVVVYVPCASLPSQELRRSTNLLLEQAAKTLDVFGEFDEAEQELYYELAGPALSRLLQIPVAGYVLALDGLDENRAYTSLEGLQTLSNQLADLRCPIVLTTRQEHLRAMFGDFSKSFFEFSTKHGPGRDARLITLRVWTDQEIIALVERVMSIAEEAERVHLRSLEILVRSGEHRTYYGELLSHPLFAQMILENVARDGVRHTSRPELIRDWVEAKIWRDQSVPRVRPGEPLDVIAFASAMMELMERIAFVMLERIDGRIELTENVSSSIVEEEARNVFEDSSVSVLAVLLNSLLEPVGLRTGRVIAVRFSFRIVQECLLAYYIHKHGILDEGFPESVRSFVRDLASVAA
jgi:hypothetical protein